MKVGLLATDGPMALKALYCLQRLGARTDVIDLRGTNRTKYSRYRSGYARIDPPAGRGDADRVAEFLNALIERRGLEVIVPGDIFCSGLLHELKERLNVPSFPVSDFETLEALDDKWRFYELLVAHAVPTPRSVLVESPADVERLVDMALTFPVLVKPLLTESGHGIVRFDEMSRLRSYLRDGAAQYADLPLQIQEFADGYDADLSFLAIDGEVVAQVIQSRRHAGVLEFIRHDDVSRLGEKIARIVNFSGVANIDVRIDEASSSVTVLECNPRFWYTLQASMWRGVNFVEHGIEIARGSASSAVAPEGGKYYLHGYLLKRTLWRPSEWKSVEKYNWLGLLQTLTDPIPILYIKWRAVSTRLITWASTRLRGRKA